MRILFQQYDTDQSGEYTDDIAQFRYLTREQADKANESLIASGSALRWLEVKEETEHEDSPSLADVMVLPFYNS